MTSASDRIKLAALGLVAGATVGAATVQFVGGWEGMRREVYLDVGGVPTVCFGATQGIEDRTYSEAECQRMLEGDLLAHTEIMMRSIRVPLSQGETVAYSSLVFNIGVNAFAGSTLLQLLNAGDRAGACKQLLRWVNVQGRVVRGLVNRRNAEYALCIGPRLASR